MASKPGFLTYLTAAFNARPWGMFVAPNWIGVSAFGLLGLTNPGFWVLGAGLELGYLLLLSTNERFQRVVNAASAGDAKDEWQGRIDGLVKRLGASDRHRYLTLSNRCHSILDLQSQGASVAHGLDSQVASLGRLSWTFLRLLVTRQVITSVLAEGDSPTVTEQRIEALERQAADTTTGEDLRRSVTSQVDILRQRLAQRREGERRLAFVYAELTRIEEQVELVREQAALSTDPEGLSRRIDEIAATLGATGQWIRDQQQVFGSMEDLVTEPPPLPGAARVRQSQ